MFVRLTRESPWKAQIGCSALLAVIVAAPGLFIGYMTYFHDRSENRTVMFWFAGAWVFVGLLLLLSAIHQTFAVRSPETIVEIEPDRFTPGEPVRIRLTQPGPLKLLSIHANLTGEEITWTTRRDGRRTNITRYPGPYRMLEAERCNIELGDRMQREATFTVPGIGPSVDTADFKRRWKIEIWGRVSHWPDFMHPFPVTVVSAAGASPRRS